MGVGKWLKRMLGLGLALILCAGLWWLRPASAGDVALAVIDGTSGTTVMVPARPPAATPAPDEVPLTITQSRSGIEMYPTQMSPTRGFIFYPGALVDPRAYANILAPIAAADYFVTILKTPFDLPITDISAAASVIDSHREIDSWIVGGHSLGGVAASTFAAGNPSAVAGLVLWGSYPAADLSSIGQVGVISVSGTEDGLTTPSDVAASIAKLPPTTTFVAVDGSIHAFFGDYGEQAGDGTPTISRAEAQAKIVDATLQWLNSLAVVA